MVSLQVKDIFYDYMMNHYDVIIDTETSQLRYICGGLPLAFQYGYFFSSEEDITPWWIELPVQYIFKTASIKV